jgi:adenylyltransferase/sulfurtransferase
MDASDMTFNELKIRKSSSCPVCGADKRITRLIDYEQFCGTRREPMQNGELSPVQLKEMIDSGKEITLLDVREPSEFSLCHLEHSTLIPLGVLPERLKELDPMSEIVVYCHTGIRSANAVAFLLSRGFTKARNLRGGIAAWAEEVDSNMPRY